MEMLAAKFLPVIRNSLRQIVPPVIATLLAAVLIAGYNRAFSGHLMQPRMAAVQGKIGKADEVASPSPTAQPREVTEAIAVLEAPPVQERIFAKADEREAAKDATPIKIAALVPAPAAAEPVAAPAAAPVRAARKAEPRLVEQRNEPRPVPVPVVVAQPPMIAAAPIAAPQPMMQQPITAQPVIQDPQVIAAKPMVTVPDRPRTASPYETAVPEPEVVAPPPPQGGPLERFVDTLRPSSIFARMREFGDRIEAAGNDILPNVRP
jgi:hypothetical protein